MDAFRAGRVLIARVEGRFAAIPLIYVLEVMRPLAIQALADMPAAVLGLATIRGDQIPVVDLARLLTGRASAQNTRFVTLRTGAQNGRVIALAVDRIEGIRDFHESNLVALPPLMGAAQTETLQAIGTLDSQLLMVLRTARLLDENAWSRLDELIRK